MEASGLLAECFDASYEAWKPDIRSSGVRLCSASVQDISCLPASSIVFALFTSRSSVYPHSGQTNVLSESVMSSFKAPQRGHILVDGKNLSKIRTFGFDSSFLLRVPSAEFYTCFPNSPFSVTLTM